MNDGPAGRGPILGEQAFRLSRVENVAVIEALGPGTTQDGQAGILQCGLHSFGHHSDPKGVGQADHSTDDGFILPVGAEPSHEGAIDLENGDRETTQIAQG